MKNFIINWTPVVICVMISLVFALWFMGSNNSRYPDDVTCVNGYHGAMECY